MTEIGTEAFQYCSSLKEITLPDSVIKIRDGAFSYCKSLTSITIPDSVTEIGTEAFRYCLSLKEITLSNSITKIAERAFYNCSLTSITIPYNVTKISKEAFYDCQSLTSVKIPYVIKIDSLAFSSSSKIQELPYIEVILDEDILKQLGYTLEYQKMLFIKKLISLKKDGNDVTNFDIPATYKYNGEYYKIIEIGDNVFSGCSSLMRVTIPKSVTKVGKNAFKDCKSLTISIPKNCSSYDSSFKNCKKVIIRD